MRRKARTRREMPEGLDEAGQRTWRLKEQMRIEDAKGFAERAAYDASLVKERLREGFRLHFPREVYGRWREDVAEKGLRSTQFGLPGQLLVASCRKGGELRTSWDKANLGVENRSKLLALDLPYIEGNKTFLSFWRIDLDGTWPSVADFRYQLLQLVGCEIPIAPHLVAGDELPDGSFKNPHLIFFLPPGQAVWNDPEDPRCRMVYVKHFEGVYYGIVKALQFMHADPGAPATTQRAKNPLSPLSTPLVLNEHDFLTMSEWSGWVDTSLRRETLVRESAAAKAGVDLKTSNSLFTAVQKEAYALLRRWYFESDLRIRGRSEGGIADELHAALEPVAQELAVQGGTAMTAKQVALMVSRVASFAAGAFDPARLDKGIVRQALAHIVDGISSVRERQRVAAEYASKEKAEKTLARLVEAWDALAVETTDLTKSGLAREAGVSRTTVQSRWSDLQSVLESRKGRPVRCIDKRHVVVPAGQTNDTAASHSRAPRETVLIRVESHGAAATPKPNPWVEAGREASNPFRVPPARPAVRRDTAMAAPRSLAFLSPAYGSDAARRIVVPSPCPDVAHDGGRHDDDWDEIAEQEAFLASDGDAGSDWDEPDGYVVDRWPDRSVTLRH